MTFRGLLLAALLALGLAPRAEATILFAGGEDIDFTNTGAVTLTTSASAIRSGYAREAIAVASGTTADPPSVRFATPAFTATTSFWVHHVVFINSTTFTSGQQYIRLMDGSTARIIVRGSGTASTLKISTRNGAGTITDLVTCSAVNAVSTPKKVDLFINYAVSGQVTLYYDGINICDYSGDVTTNSATTLSGVEFGQTGSAATVDYSEIIVATVDTRNMNLVTWQPVANGNTQAWTGAASDVNETTLSDATLISSTTNDQLAQFTVGLLPSGSWSVNAVVQAARLLVGATGPQNFRWSLRVSSADYDNGADLPGTTSFAVYRKIWETSPATSSAWTSGEVTTSFNSGLKARN